MPRNAVSEALGEGLGGVDALPVDDSIWQLSCFVPKYQSILTMFSILHVSLSKNKV